MPILVRKVTAGDAVPFFPTYLGPGQSVPVAWPETFLRPALPASRHWQGPLVLSTAFLGCQSLPVATGRVRWCYPLLSLAVTRCQSLLVGSAGITRHLAGLALAAGCYRPCSSVIDIAANDDWPVLLELIVGDAK